MAKNEDSPVTKVQYFSTLVTVLGLLLSANAFFYVRFESRSELIKADSIKYSDQQLKHYTELMNRQQDYWKDWKSEHLEAVHEGALTQPDKDDLIARLAAMEMRLKERINMVIYQK